MQFFRKRVTIDREHIDFIFREIEKSFNSSEEGLAHTEMLRSGNLSDVQKEEYPAVIEDEALRLSYMATNMLNLTKTVRLPKQQSEP